MVTIKSKKEIALMGDVCKIVAKMYEELEKHIKPGISTWEINEIAEKITRDLGGIPAQIGYDVGIRGIPPYPAAICTSINEEVIHGIPSKSRILQEGDIISVDTVIRKNGFHGDAARTFKVGKVSKEAEKLIDITKQAFYEGIKYAVPGNRVGDIGYYIHEFIKSHGFTVVKEFQGHGIGRQMHEEPGVPNYGKAGRGIRLEPGMTIAVEPMVIVGNSEILELEDGWTIMTRDGSLSCHYENTILITEKEPKILTL